MNLLPFDEINNLRSYLEGTVPFITDDEIVDKAMDILILAYMNGTDYANGSLGTSYKAKTDEIQKSLSKTYEGIGYEERIRNYANSDDVTSIIKVVETESHRIFNEAELNVARASGKQVFKTWNTMFDDKVRDAHWELEGVTVPINEKFYVGENGTDYPGGFGVPDLDINCRCILTLTTK